YGLSHEIRNPLGALFLHIDLLEEEFRDPTPESPTVMVQTFGEIRTALTRLDELVQDYLSLVRVGTIELGVQDIGAAVQTWTAEMRLPPIGVLDIPDVIRSTRHPHGPARMAHRPTLSCKQHANQWVDQEALHLR